MMVLLVGLVCLASAGLGYVAGVGLSKSYEDVVVAARRAVNFDRSADAENAIEELDAALRAVNR